MKTPKKHALPILPRATVWTAERIAALPAMLDVRQLEGNALRLGEPKIAALCSAEMTRRRREALAAPKPPPVVKPRPRPKPKVLPPE